MNAWRRLDNPRPMRVMVGRTAFITSTPPVLITCLLPALHRSPNRLLFHSGGYKEEDYIDWPGPQAELYRGYIGEPGLFIGLYTA